MGNSWRRVIIIWNNYNSDYWQLFLRVYHLSGIQDVLRPRENKGHSSKDDRQQPFLLEQRKHNWYDKYIFLMHIVCFYHMRSWNLSNYGLCCAIDDLYQTYIPPGKLPIFTSRFKKYQSSSDVNSIYYLQQHILPFHLRAFTMHFSSYLFILGRWRNPWYF